MAWQTEILVVANVTADSDELLSALEARTASGPAAFTLIVPPRAAGEEGRREATARLERALSRGRERGLVIDGRLGDPDPVLAVDEVFDPRRFDEIIVSTLPVGVSQWLQVDLPHRIGRMTGVPVRHVISQEPRPPLRSTSPRPIERRGVLAALTPLAWGGRAAGRRR